MNVIKLQREPAIIDVEFPEFEKFSTDLLFEAMPQRVDYGNLDVEPQRYTILPRDDRNNEFNLFSKEIYDPIRLITKQLVESDHLRYPLLDSPNFDVWYTKRYASRIKIAYSRTVDQPGFHQGWHLDNRFVLLSGIINVQDNNTQTAFAREQLPWIPEDVNGDKIIHRGQNKKWTGTFWLNTEITWHCVPLVETTRKIILCNLFL